MVVDWLFIRPQPFKLALPPLLVLLLLLPFKPYEQPLAAAGAGAGLPLPFAAARLMALLVNAMRTSSEEGDTGEQADGDNNGEAEAGLFSAPLLLM